MSGVAQHVDDSGLGRTSEGSGFRLDSMSTVGGSQEDLDAVRLEFEDAERAEQADIAGGTPPPARETAPAKTETETETVDTPAPAKTAAPATTDEPKPAKAPGERRLDAIQQRIAHSTRESHTLTGEIASKRAELEDLDRQLAEKRGPAPKVETQAPKPAQAAGDDPKPRWTGEKGYENQGKTYAEYEDDLEAWEGRRDARTREDVTKANTEDRARFDQQAADRAIDQRHTARVTDLIGKDAEFAAAINDPDFQSMPQTPFMGTLIKLHPAGHEVLRHLALNPADGYAFADLPLSTEMKQAFRDSDDPVRLLTALANDPEKAAQIARLSGSRALKALWALESPSTDAKAGPTSTARQPVATPLPAKVQASRSVAAARPKRDLSTDDIDEFEAREAAGEAD